MSEGKLDISNILKQKLLEYIAMEATNLFPENNRQNRMGCSEKWYDPMYSITHTFTATEIEDMSEKELAKLYKLAINMAEAFY